MITLPEPASDLVQNRAQRTLLPCVLAGVFTLLWCGLILLGVTETRARADEQNYHLPAVLHFAEQLPLPDLSDYPSATTPGYHLLLSLAAKGAGFAGWTDGEGLERLLRLATALLSGALIWVLAIPIVRRAGAVGLVLALPFACSLYVAGSATHVLPDNAGWLGVFAVLALCLNVRAEDDRPSWGWLAGAGAALAVLVLVRQAHLWAAAAIWAAAWMAPEPDRGPFEEFGRRIRSGLLGAAATLPAFAVVAAFFVLWGGLTPPMFQGLVEGEAVHQAVNPATPAFILLQAAVFGPFFAGWLLPGLRLRRDWGWLAGAAAVGLLLAVLPETTFSVEEGRFAGFWGLVRRAPVLGGRTSLLVLAAAPVGAAVLGAGVLACRGSARWVLLVSVAAFVAAQTANGYAWQRYHEPFLLGWLGACGACAVPRPGGTNRPVPGAVRRGMRVRLLQMAGPMALAGLLAALTADIMSARRGEAEGPREAEVASGGRSEKPMFGGSGPDGAGRSPVRDVRRSA